MPDRSPDATCRQDPRSTSAPLHVSTPARQVSTLHVSTPARQHPCTSGQHAARQHPRAPPLLHVSSARCTSAPLHVRSAPCTSAPRPSAPARPHPRTSAPQPPRTPARHISARPLSVVSPCASIGSMIKLISVYPMALAGAGVFAAALSAGGSSQQPAPGGNELKVGDTAP